MWVLQRIRLCWVLPDRPRRRHSAQEPGLSGESPGNLMPQPRWPPMPGSHEGAAAGPASPVLPCHFPHSPRCGTTVWTFIGRFGGGRGESCLQSPVQLPRASTVQTAQPTAALPRPCFFLPALLSRSRACCPFGRVLGPTPRVHPLNAFARILRGRTPAEGLERSPSISDRLGAGCGLSAGGLTLLPSQKEQAAREPQAKGPQPYAPLW